jgi:diaminopimelate decarboxylase
VGEGVLTDVIHREGDHAWSEDVPLERLAAAVGTPTYVYSTAAIRDQYRALDTALHAVPHRIHYSVKANGNLAVLRLLHALGAGVDIVSGGELYRSRLAGFVGDDVVFSGVGKTVAEIQQALRARVRLINIESEGELAVVAAEAAKLETTATVALRVNPEVEVSSPHAYIRTGERGTKFGIAYDDARAVAATLRTLSTVRLAGLDMHLGSQISGTEPYAAAIDRLLALYRNLVADGFDTLQYLDVGGGLALAYDREVPTDAVDFAAVVAPAIAPTGLTLLVEPGRFLVGHAGILLTRVLYRKRTGGKTYVITDAGMNDFLRPSHYGAYHRIEPVGAVRSAVESTVDIVGPVCESGDFFALDRELAHVESGDLLMIRSVGAYGYAMASNYNARPRPAEVLVDGDRYAVVTARETYEDLVRRERSTLDWREA